ncbi:MAG TPA: (d)CMP kinase, partial [Isosphaeraceae bacterium]|nr:(d)CMP kinase [Isosphaeraceae bacterium]
MGKVVAIDGPAGAGKSTVARRLADRLGWAMLDTGAMYRAVALAALRSGTSLDHPDELTALAERLKVRLLPGRVLLNDEDVTLAIRQPEVSQASSRVAVCPGVRSRLVVWQRAFAAERDTVTEGRDQGSVVFPDATRKFFLTASPQSRALRRCREYEIKGLPADPDEVLREILERDARDASRDMAPMKPAPDALVLDTTDLPTDQVLE